MNETSALTPQEVADILKIAKNTVYELIKRGELNSYRVGKKVRVDYEDVEEYKNRTKTIKKKSSRFNEIAAPGAGRVMPEDSPESHNLIICGQDIMLDILSRHIQLHPDGTQVLRSYAGSYNGLYLLYQGKVHMASTHLWDGDTGEYNVPYVRRMLPGVPALIIHLACRMQGFYVAKNNPKKIKDWEDLKRKDITVINRESGSGTRVLLDEHLRLLGIPAGSINGYRRESSSHLAIASIVARGGADIGIGNEKTSLQVKGIDFIPLQKERYELIIKKEDISRPPFNATLNIIQSPEFKMELEGIGGYDLSETGTVVAGT